jgi:hypothetical protein
MALVRRSQFWLCVVLVIVATGASGCKKASGTVPIHGHASYRGEPLKRAVLTFFPTKGRPESISISQGEYASELTPGEYTVTIIVPTELPRGFKEGDPTPPPAVELPDEYASRAKSTLKATVKAGNDQSIDFDLK